MVLLAVGARVGIAGIVGGQALVCEVYPQILVGEDGVRADLVAHGAKEGMDTPSRRLKATVSSEKALSLPKTSMPSWSSPWRDM